MIKTVLIRCIFFLSIGILVLACQENQKPRIPMPVTNLSDISLIPKPTKTIATNSAFALDQFTAIYTSKSATGFDKVGKFLAEKLKAKINLDIPVNQETTNTIDRVIYINQSDSIVLETPEAYQLYINQDSIILNANTAEGAFRGIQTLRQLVPDVSTDTLAEQKIWPVPSGKIIDSPNFGYRGAMLDVARHFFSVEDVKKYIDLLSYYKINMLHLHLSDDQGWRIEIKSWPKLTEIGGSTEVGGESGGFYTQEDYKEIVRYAQERYMTVIPEIDMPGHTNSASASYPFLNGNGKTPELYEGMRVGFSTFDTRKDTVYSFIDDVVREISEMTPGPYFHMGGDESHVTKKNDYIYFVNRVEKIVQKHGKRMIGWDEIANADIDSNAIAQWWASEENAKKAVEKNMKVIVSPAKKAYLDMQYDTLTKLGLHWAGYIPVDTAYQWTPEEYGIPMENILGTEAPLWSETITNIEELEYLAFPRVIGYSELAWSIPENRNWEDYKVRLGDQAPFLERMNVNYYPSKLIDWKKSKFTYETIEKD
ncbi:family 20 glycosylhydrolase [Maribacter sp. PR1]|uniref:beta-N-acetylhexosaminidase n=1 Tax=Maribacter cobaltidurans TaxID=1178778 RepID=A0ABU7IXH8_9FLAO|nr:MULTISPECIES: family 20 glycosylhydrolase [Maribacter]MDC6390290.1 family 20 glycosylhydrolase [Maribacter sp. PR1]MEE1977680.1 family 20 glycosylhydrolase [Maribacter cobaltidurans]